MDERETKQLMEDVASVMKSLVSLSLAPVLARVSAIETALAAMPVPKDGKSVTVDDVAPMIRGEVEKAAAGLVAAIPDVAGMVAQAVSAEADRLAASVKAEPQVVTMTFDAEPLRQGIAALEEQIKAIDIDEAVKAALDALPKPQDGKSVTVEDVAPLIEERVSLAVSALPKAKDGENGKDGLGLADALIDRDGNLILTMTDGRHKNLGRVEGDPGKPGEPGTPGLDGVSMSHFDTEMKDERTIVFKFVRDDSIVEMHEFSFPVLIDRGVWSDGKTYVKGDCCTWGGSLWICQRETSAKPDSPDSGWRLAVKKGRDGKDKA